MISTEIELNSSHDDDQSPEALIELLDHSDPLVQWQAAERLAQVALDARSRNVAFWAQALGRDATLDIEEILARLAQALDGDDTRLRLAVVDALGAFRHTACLPHLRDALMDPVDQVRAAAAAALAKCADVDSIGDLMDVAQHDTSVWARTSAIDALGALGQPNIAPLLRDMLTELNGTPSEDKPGENGASSATYLIKTRIVSAMGHLDHGQARATLMLVAEQDDDPSLQWLAARGLEKVGGSEALVVLESLLGNDTVILGQSIGEVADHAIVAIKRREAGLTAWLRQALYRVSRFARRIWQRIQAPHGQ